MFLSHSWRCQILLERISSYIMAVYNYTMLKHTINRDIGHEAVWLLVPFPSGFLKSAWLAVGSALVDKS